MSLFDWFSKDEDGVVVKTVTSKGLGKPSMAITVGDIKRGIAIDEYGYKNEVVLFLRLNKKDR